MIRVLQFADVINRYDFMDALVQRTDRGRFVIGVCVRTSESYFEAPVYPRDTPQWTLNGISRWEIPRAAFQLARLLRRWGADILHAHHYDQAVIGLLATWLYPGTKLVVGRHYSDAIYRSSRGWKRKALLAVEQAVNRAAARIVVPSSYIAEIVSGWQKVPPGKVDRVPYGFVAEKYAAPRPSDVRCVREELGLAGRFAVGTFGRLHEEKGQRFLVRAMAEVRARDPDVILLVVGEGSERAALERQIKATGLGDRVRLLGWRRDTMVLMAAVDAVVQPTLQEAFSQVMAEALWMGKPLVITDVGGVTDVIRDGENGLLVPKADPNALAGAVARLVADAPLRARLGAAGRAYVEEQLTIEKIIPMYEQVYLRAMGA